MSEASGYANLHPHKLSYTIKEAIEATGLKRSVLYEERAAGRLEFRKRGKTVLIMRAELERYLALLPTQP